MTRLLAAFLPAVLALGCESGKPGDTGTIGTDGGSTDGGSGDGGSDGGSGDGGSGDGGSGDGGTDGGSGDGGTDGGSGDGGTDGGSGDGGTDGGSGDGGSDGGSGDGGSGEPGVPTWCIDFEDDSLEAVGYEGNFHEGDDGGLVFTVAEGDDWSALEGEEALELRDTYALVLRSSHLGDPKSEGTATTNAFEVTEDQLWWWHLSEVDERGVELTGEILDETGTVVLSTLSLPVETGGFVPQLKPEHEDIEGFPEITTSSATVGTLLFLVTDLSAFHGQRVRLRLRQRTTVRDNGFFTVFDDICLGTSDIAELEWPAAE